VWPAPEVDCALCPRLVDLRRRNRAVFPDWHNAPVASFGERGARLLVVGLAPGLRGANRTGRPFTGDAAGEILYRTLVEHGFARGVYRAAPDDGLELVDCRITNAVRCVPPENRPSGAEINACRRCCRLAASRTARWCALSVCRCATCPSGMAPSTDRRRHRFWHPPIIARATI
jgi:uracil-DNA glycosylase family 4